jgi:hypothetical protein
MKAAQDRVLSAYSGAVGLAHRRRPGNRDER